MSSQAWRRWVFLSKYRTEAWTGVGSSCSRARRPAPPVEPWTMTRVPVGIRVVAGRVPGGGGRGGAGEALGEAVAVHGDDVGAFDLGAVLAAVPLHRGGVELDVGGLVGGEAGVAEAVDVEACDVAHLVVEDDRV